MNWKMISSCPKCGAPIYAPKATKKKDPPEPRFTCGCRLQVQPLPIMQPVTIPVYPQPVPVYPYYPPLGPFWYTITHNSSEMIGYAEPAKTATGDVVEGQISYAQIK